MLQLHLVVKESFLVLNKLTGPTGDFMMLFYCFCDQEYFGCHDVTDDVDRTSFLPKMYYGKQNIAQIGGAAH